MIENLKDVNNYSNCPLWVIGNLWLMVIVFVNDYWQFWVNRLIVRLIATIMGHLFYLYSIREEITNIHQINEKKLRITLECVKSCVMFNIYPNITVCSMPIQFVIKL